MDFPGDPRGLDVTLYPDATAKSADEISRCSPSWEESRDRLAVLRNQKSIRLKMIEDRKALLLEFCGR